MAFNINAHRWYKCKECKALFTEELMRYSHAERCKKRDAFLATLPPDKREEIRNSLGQAKSCPNPRCEGYGEKKTVSQVLFIGNKDRCRIKRYVARKEFLRRRFPWLRSSQPVC